MSLTLFSTNPSQQWVDATPFRAQVRQLMDACDLPWRVIAIAAGVPSTVVYHLVFGRNSRPIRRIRYVDATALIALSPARLLALGAAQCPFERFVSVIEELRQRGLSIRTIARFAGVSHLQLRQWRSGQLKAPMLALWRLLAAAEAWGADMEEILHCETSPSLVAA